MTPKTSSPSLEALHNYCTSCHIPPLLIPELAGKVQSTLEGKIEGIQNKETLQKKLAELKRFPRHFGYNQKLRMNYQDYVGVHQERMHAIVEMFTTELADLGIDIPTLLFLCRYHDSPEAISVFGDLPTPIKDAFDEESQSIHILYERAIIKILSKQILIGNDLGIPREQIQSTLELTIEKKELLGQILSYIDKFDAMMICFHEVMSGNRNFFTGKLKWYKKFFGQVQIGKKLPLLKEFMTTIPDGSCLHTLFSPDTVSQIEKARKDKQDKKPYTKDDIHRSYGVPAYLLWKTATLRIEECVVGEDVLSGEEILIQQRK